MARTQVQAELIATNAISGTIIADNAITATHIATNSISGTLVQDSGIVTSMIAANNVTSTKIVTDAVLTRHIADDQVTEDKLANAINTSIAAKLPLAGGTVTGNITMGGMILKPSAQGGSIGLNRNPNDGSHVGDSSLRRFQINGPDSTGGDLLQIQSYNSSGTHQGNINIQDGHLGVGMTPAVLGSDTVLTVYDSATPRIKLHNSTTGTASSDGGEINMSSSDLIIENREAGSQRFFTNGSERMRIDDGGYVGIRDTSPDAVLKVNSTGGGSELVFKLADASDNSVFEVQGGGTAVFQYGKVGIGTTSPDQMLHVSKGSAGSIDSHSTSAITIEDNDHVTLQFLTPNDKQNNIYFGDVDDNAHGIIRYDHSTTKLHFGTDGNPNKMVLDNGQLSLGDSTPESGDAETPKNLFLEGGECNMVIKNTDATSGSQRQGIAFLNSGGTRVGTITITTSTTGFTHNSDYRLKENIDYTWDATTRLKQLKPVRFNWIVDDTNTLVDGFLAHEVSSVVPEAVTGEKDGDEMQGIDQSKLIPLLVKTIQELEARITTLEG